MTTDDRRQALARGIVRLLSRAISDPAALSIAVDSGIPGSAGESAREQAGEASAFIGVPVMDDRVRTARVVIHGPDALLRIMLPPTADSFGEGFVRGDLEVEGDLMAAIAAGRSLALRRLSADDLRRLMRWALELRLGAGSGPATLTRRPAALTRVARLTGERHTRARDAAAIRFHHDVGEAFYSLWLDRRMTYSCAYFPGDTRPEDAASRLDEAQEAKLDLIAAKLDLAPGQRLLDIGCGWGSLIVRAAETRGVDAVGVTLSERQANEANLRAAAAGMAGRARARVLDYRDLAGFTTFDAAASVGMFEHVGRANLPVYFRAAYDAIRPGGLFLNHGIVRTTRGGALRRQLSGRPAGFLDKYVFPDGELVTVEECIAIARGAGFELIDVQSLRPHYALTLAAWVARLEDRWSEAVAAAGAEIARTWRLYMSAARLAFERGDCDVVQLLLARPAGGGPAPRRIRPWW